MYLGSKPASERLNGIKRVPRCTTKAQYMKWLRACALSGARAVGRYGFCTDCTKEFQGRMIHQGKCEHPKLDLDKVKEHEASLSID